MDEHVYILLAGFCISVCVCVCVCVCVAEGVLNELQGVVVLG